MKNNLKRGPIPLNKSRHKLMLIMMKIFFRGKIILKI